MREIAVISGKGGTGKTSITASFAHLATNPVLVDCDVDAANLHLVMQPTVREEHPFAVGAVMRIEPERCRGCGLCAKHCRFDAIYPMEVATPSGRVRRIYQIDHHACEGCTVCLHTCHFGAIVREEVTSGWWYVSDTRVGPMVHAKLGVGQENSGKLVTEIRKAGRALAEAAAKDVVLVDGPPGVGCPVVATIGGADHVVAVAEPTVAGVHDLGRAVALAQHFGVPASLIINKADLNPSKTQELEAFAASVGVRLLGQIPHDPVFVQAQLAGQSVVEYQPHGPAAAALRSIWADLIEQ